MNPSLRECLLTLAHDLNGSWSTVNMATGLLNEPNLPPDKYQLYEDMVSRNIASVRTILNQMRGHLPEEDVCSTVIELVDNFKVHRSITAIGQLSSLICELNKSLTRLV